MQDPRCQLHKPSSAQCAFQSSQRLPPGLESVSDAMKGLIPNQLVDPACVMSDSSLDHRPAKRRLASAKPEALPGSCASRLPPPIPWQREREWDCAARSRALAWVNYLEGTEGTLTRHLNMRPAPQQRDEVSFPTGPGNQHCGPPVTPRKQASPTPPWLTRWSHVESRADEMDHPDAEAPKQADSAALGPAESRHRPAGSVQPSPRALPGSCASRLPPPIPWQTEREWDCAASSVELAEQGPAHPARRGSAPPLRQIRRGKKIERVSST